MTPQPHPPFPGPSESSWVDPCPRDKAHPVGSTVELGFGKHRPLSLEPGRWPPRKTPVLLTREHFPLESQAIKTMLKEPECWVNVQHQRLQMWAPGWEPSPEALSRPPQV